MTGKKYERSKNRIGMKNMKFLIITILTFAFQQWSAQIFIADTNICATNRVWFKDTNSVPAGKTVQDRLWDFDGVNKDSTALDSISFQYANAIGSGLYTVFLTIRYTDGSSTTFSKVVRIWSLPIIDSFIVERPITCPGVEIRFRVYSRTDATYGAPYDISKVEFGDLNAANPSGPVDASTLIHKYGAMGVYRAEYIVTDLKKCVNKATAEVRIIKTPEVKFLAINPRCKDSSVLYENRTDGRDSFWSWNWKFIDSEYVKGVLIPDSFVKENTRSFVGNGKIFENATHIHPWYARYSPSRVILWGVNRYNCRDSADIFITNVDTTPKLVFTPRVDTTICYGESVQYLVRGSDTLWYDNFHLGGTKISGDSIVLFTPKNTTTYTVYGKTPQCPPISEKIKISVVQPIETKISTEPQYILRGATSSVKLITNGIIDSLRWSPDSTMSSPLKDSTGAAPKFTTTYKVKLYYSLNNYICAQEDSATVFVNTECQVDSLKIPTAFTPNGDALNDEFYVKSFALKTVLSFNVYNRWGNRVFNVDNVPADDKQYYWNGKINNNGEDVPPGVYIYNISAVCKNDQILNFQGEITVLR